MKYRKKPVVVTAEQFFEAQLPWPEGVEQDVIAGERNSPHIKTLEGPMLVRDGDWVITGVKGEHYPCKPDIFAATYELVSGEMETYPDGIDGMNGGERTV